MADFIIKVSAQGEATIDRLDSKVKKLDNTAVKTQKSSDRLAGSIKAIATAAVAYVTVDKLTSSLTSLATSAINTTAQFEQFNAILTTIEGSALKAEQSMQWITDFTSRTPYELANVTESFVRLKSYGLEPTDGLLKTLGDTASAMGKDIMQAVEAISSAVVGENERLKAFGITAKVQGEQIAYSWTNASGEARQAIVENNSSIIKSTLEAIFNSKYAGAMETQSRTWNGLISNMKDSWTIFQSSIMQEGGVFDYLKAIVTVVGENMTNAFSSAQDGAKDFGLGVIETIKGTIRTIGFMYDSVESMGDIFGLMGAGARAAFYGIQIVSSNVTLSIYRAFESTVQGIDRIFTNLSNGIISSFESVINSIISGYNAIAGTVGLPMLNQVSFQRTDYTNFNMNDDIINLLSERVIPATEGFAKAQADAERYMAQLSDAEGGRTFADRFIADIDKAYETIKNQIVGGDAKVDFGDDPDSIEDAALALEDFKTEMEEIEKTIKDIDGPAASLGDNLSYISQTITEDDGLYDGFYNIQDSFNNLIDTNDDLVDSYRDVERATKRFIFQWERTFIGSIQNNMSSLERVFSSTDGATSKSYQQALIEAIEAQNALISNPLDVTIGDKYESAYRTLVDSAMAYLTPSNFGSTQEASFASARVGLELEDMRDTAVKAYDVQQAMLDALNVMNAAFADGILTDEEREDIISVADKVNAKNQDLLKDNTILGKDGTINSLYKGEDINAQVNTISGYATNAALTGRNSVSSFIGSLKDSIESGVSIESLLDATTLAAAATGLKTDQISNVKTATDAAARASQQTTGAVNDNSIKGNVAKTLDNLRIREEDTRLQYYSTGDGVFGGLSNTDERVGKVARQTTRYDYYNKGGYTGDGGTMQEAGIVHRGEFVVNKENTAKLGLNQDLGNVFTQMNSKMALLVAENRDMKSLMIRLVADNSKMLSTDRAMLAQMTA